MMNFNLMKNFILEHIKIYHFYLYEKVYFKPYLDLIWFVFEFGFEDEIGKNGKMEKTLLSHIWPSDQSAQLSRPLSFLTLPA